MENNLSISDYNYQCNGIAILQHILENHNRSINIQGLSDNNLHESYGDSWGDAS